MKFGHREGFQKPKNAFKFFHNFFARPKCLESPFASLSLSFPPAAAYLFFGYAAYACVLTLCVCVCVFTLPFVHFLWKFQSCKLL